MASDNSFITSALSSEGNQLVKNQLELILASKYFKSAKQMQRFLKYIVEKKIAGEEKVLKQYTIAVEALLFKDNFDPDDNPAVRIMGGRVRQRLNEYYDDDSNHHEIIISIPKGSYIPEFNKNTGVKNNENTNNQVSRGPTLAVVSFTDRIQSQKTNQIHIQAIDAFATELSRFLCLQLVVCNPYADKDKSHLVEAEMKSSNRADYILALFFLKMDVDEDKYRFIYRLTLVETGEILWSENYVITGNPLEKQDFVIAKITATVADHLQGVMHTHWSRNLLANLDSIPDCHKVLVYFRNYTDSLGRGAFIKGVIACLEALDRNPNDVVANLIYVAYCRREYVYGFGVIRSPLEKGKKCIETAIRLSPNSHEVRYMYGEILFHHNDWVRSAEQFELARSISTNNIVTEFGIGFHLCLMNKWDKGLLLVNKAMLLSSNYHSYYHLVPCLDFYRQGKFEQALYEAQKINIPRQVQGTLARCVCYVQLGELEEAEEEFQEILNRCPEFMQKGRLHLTRFLGTKKLADKIWDDLLKVSNSLK